MALRLYDLAARDDRRFSPYCWRIKFALAYKGLAYATEPVRFCDKDKLAFSGQHLVPVLVDGDHVVADSWAIALYLDRAYPDTPRLCDSDQSRGRALFVKSWCERVLQIALFRLVALDIHNALEPPDQAYFRASREQRVGMRLEEFVADVDGNLNALRLCLEPLRSLLATQPYIDGGAAGFADFLIAGAFVWATSVASTQLLDQSDPVCAWRQRLFEAFDGLAANAVAQCEPT